jgi:hypothetical protein
MIPTQADLAADLGLDEQSALNVHSLLRLANARGRAGRWPDQDFERAEDWQRDGYLIDRVAILAEIDPGPIFTLYQLAHSSGLAARREMVGLAHG